MMTHTMIWLHIRTDDEQLRIACREIIQALICCGKFTCINLSPQPGGLISKLVKQLSAN